MCHYTGEKPVMAVFEVYGQHCDIQQTFIVSNVTVDQQCKKSSTRGLLYIYMYTHNGQN